MNIFFCRLIFSLRKKNGCHEGPYVSLCSRLIAAADVLVILPVALRSATRHTNHRPCHCFSQCLGVVTGQWKAAHVSYINAVSEDFDRAEANSHTHISTSKAEPSHGLTGFWFWGSVTYFPWNGQRYLRPAGRIIRCSTSSDLKENVSQRKVTVLRFAVHIRPATHLAISAYKQKFKTPYWNWYISCSFVNLLFYEQWAWGELFFHHPMHNTLFIEGALWGSSRLQGSNCVLLFFHLMKERKLIWESASSGRRDMWNTNML